MTELRIALYEFNPPRVNEYALVAGTGGVPDGKFKEEVGCFYDYNKRNWDSVDRFFKCLDIDIDINWDINGKKTSVLFKCRSDEDLQFILRHLKRFIQASSHQEMWYVFDKISKESEHRPAAPRILPTISARSSVKSAAEPAPKAEKPKEETPAPEDAEEAKKEAEPEILAQQLAKIAREAAKENAARLWVLVMDLAVAEAKKGFFKVSVIVGDVSDDKYYINDPGYHSKECIDELKDLAINDGFDISSKRKGKGYRVKIEWRDNDW